MAEQNLWQRLIAAIDREYERRVRAASRISEYGNHHTHGEHGLHASDDGEEALIANVPRGTRLARPASEPSAHSADQH